MKRPPASKATQRSTEPATVSVFLPPSLLPAGVGPEASPIHLDAQFGYLDIEFPYMVRDYVYAPRTLSRTLVVVWAIASSVK